MSGQVLSYPVICSLSDLTGSAEASFTSKVDLLQDSMGMHLESSGRLQNGLQLDKSSLNDSILGLLKARKVPASGCAQSL
jgi:hypothetical protein